MMQNESADLVYTKNEYFQYLFYQPRNPFAQKLPLIVFLHGAGERGNEIDKVKIHGIPKMIGKNFDYECVMVAPQCPENTFWVADLPRLKCFIDKIIHEFHIDEDRVYLTGLSMGGYGTWFMAMAYPDMFAAIAPICGGGMPWNAGVLKMPVWAFHGEQDESVSCSESINMVERLKKTNLNVKLTLYPNVGHNSWDKAYNNELISWLLHQKR